VHKNGEGSFTEKFFRCNADPARRCGIGKNLVDGLRNGADESLTIASHPENSGARRYVVEGYFDNGKTYSRQGHALVGFLGPLPNRNQPALFLRLLGLGNKALFECEFVDVDLGLVTLVDCGIKIACVYVSEIVVDKSSALYFRTQSIDGIDFDAE
jgi:hypothetical protein